jgi:hypothetical protein
MIIEKEIILRGLINERNKIISLLYEAFREQKNDGFGPTFNDIGRERLTVGQRIRISNSTRCHALSLAMTEEKIFKLLRSEEDSFNIID